MSINKYSESEIWGIPMNPVIKHNHYMRDIVAAAKIKYAVTEDSTSILMVYLDKKGSLWLHLNPIRNILDIKKTDDLFGAPIVTRQLPVSSSSQYYDRFIRDSSVMNIASHIYSEKAHRLFMVIDALRINYEFYIDDIKRQSKTVITKNDDDYLTVDEIKAIKKFLNIRKEYNAPSHICDMTRPLEPEEIKTVRNRLFNLTGSI